MAQLDRAALKAFFESNDIPTQAEFGDFIDSVPNFVSDSISETKQVSVPISSAQILALAITPVVIIPAQGANTVIIPSFCTIQYKFNVIAYISDSVMFISSPLLVNFFSSPPGILNQPASLTKQLNWLNPGADLEPNTPMNLRVTVPTTGGQGTLVVTVGYTVIDVS